jgi:Ala-tRNA(Pro) deacylase
MKGLECAERARKHLADLGIAFQVSEHREAFTAQEMAAAEHAPGRKVAKAVMLLVDGNLVMAVLSAPDHVSLVKARTALRAQDVRLATEAEFGAAFPDCELGAAPPFGHLYGIATYVDTALFTSDQVVLASGNHSHSIKMALTDYVKAAGAIKVDLAA